IGTNSSDVTLTIDKTDGSKQTVITVHSIRNTWVE
ncbi:Uncharacterized protein FWK35_00030852, partial [Aphis craccivora]